MRYFTNTADLAINWHGREGDRSAICRSLSMLGADGKIAPELLSPLQTMSNIVFLVSMFGKPEVGMVRTEQNLYSQSRFCQMEEPQLRRIWQMNLSKKNIQKLAEVLGQFNHLVSELDTLKDSVMENTSVLKKILPEIIGDSSLLEEMEFSHSSQLGNGVLLKGGKNVSTLVLTKGGVEQDARLLVGGVQGGKGECPNQKKIGRRRSPIKPEPEKNIQETKSEPRSEQLELVYFLTNKIAQAHGKNADWVQEKANRAAKYMGRLLKMYDAKTLIDIVTWALEDPFWNKQVRGVAGLLSQSKSHPDHKKIELIADQMQESRKSEEQKTKEVLTIYVNRHYPEEDFADVMKDIEWFQEKVANFSPVDRQANWQYTRKMAEVLKWLTQMEKTLLSNQKYKVWSDVMVEYFKYLGTIVFPKLKGERVLGAGWFKEGSAFRSFQDYIEEKTNCTIFFG